MRTTGGHRKPTVLDGIARLVATAAPRVFTPAIDRARRDLHAVVDSVRGRSTSLVTDANPPPLAEVSAARVLLPRALAKRVLTASRDAKMLRAAVRGESAPFVVARKPRADVVRLRPKTGLGFRTLRVAAIHRETAHAVSVDLVDPKGAPLDFDAGQFLTIELDVGGERLRRAYSFSSSPRDGAIRITVKRMEGGRVSTHVNEQLGVGDAVRARGPSGSFVVPHAHPPREIVLVAGGSGITPIFSILRTVLARDAMTRVTLIYGNRHRDDVIFGDALDELAHTHTGRLTIDHVLEDDDGAPTATRGRLDRDIFAERVRALGVTDAPDVAYFVCGPDPMRAAVREALDALGVDRARVREEAFLRPEPLKDNRAPLPDGPVLAHIRARGVSRSVLVHPGKTLLEAGIEAEVPMAFSCTLGGCASCRVKLVAGQVHMEEPNCLTEAEREEGFVLACVSRPLGPIEVELDGAGEVEP